MARVFVVVVAVRSLFPKKTRSLQENSKSNWHVDRPAGQCTDALGDTCPAARGVSLDTLHRSARAGRNENKHAIVPTRQGTVPTVAAAAAAAAASVAAAADATRGAVKPTADDAALWAVKPTAADNADGLYRRACRDPHRPGLSRPPRAPPPRPWP